MRVPFLAHKNRVILNFSNGVEGVANSFATLLANTPVSKSVSIISGFLGFVYDYLDLRVGVISAGGGVVHVAGEVLGGVDAGDLADLADVVLAQFVHLFVGVGPALVMES